MSGTCALLLHQVPPLRQPRLPCSRRPLSHDLELFASGPPTAHLQHACSNPDDDERRLMMHPSMGLSHSAWPALQTAQCLSCSSSHHTRSYRIQPPRAFRDPANPVTARIVLLS